MEIIELSFRTAQTRAKIRSIRYRSKADNLVTVATNALRKAKLLCLRRVSCRITLCVNGQDSKAEIFDVFLCHNGEDKPAVREIAQMLVKASSRGWMKMK